MKITICGSLSFIDDMMKVKAELEALGHQVETPPTHVPRRDGQLITVEEMYAIYKKAVSDDQWVWDRREIAMRNHNQKIADADAVLMLNLEKNGVGGYIGMNTMLEMGLAFYLGKKIYLLNEIPAVGYREEILGMKPIVLHGDLSKIV